MLCSFLLTLGVLYARRSTDNDVSTVAITSKASVIKKATSFSLLPVRLEIKKIYVNSIVKPVGINKSGDMDISDDIENLAWYKLGPKPGEVGSAVIAGHYGWRQNQAAAFNKLHTLKQGDRVIVYDKNDKSISFIVRKIKTYDPTSSAADVFRSSDGKSHLNLITCDGSWDGALQTYSERLVIFTDKIPA